MSAFALGGAVPAMAAPEVGAAPARYAITGTVNASDGDGGVVPLEGVEASVSFTEPGESGSRYPTTTQADGSFAFASDQTFPVGDYTVVFALEGFVTAEVPVQIVDADVVMEPVTMEAIPEALAAGTVSIAGTPVVGDVLTAATEGWPSGTTFRYEWYYSCGQCGGPFDGENASTYTVGNEAINYWVGVIVTGSKDGYADATVNALLETIATAPQKAPAPAPADLAAYLQSSGSTPMTQSEAGLPAGVLDPGVTQTATLAWTAQDSFVDVYAFSSPVFVGTFPVVNGSVQIALSPAVLAQLAAGSHTLVVTGQSSGAVMSVALAVGLPSTGADAALPFTIGSALVLLGAALVLVRRRMLASI
jgi:LPXTG-motif cell wall-anchored protein